MEQKIKVLGRRLAMDEQTFAPVMVVTIAIPMEPMQDNKKFMSATAARQELADGLVTALEGHMEEYPVVHLDDDRISSLRELSDGQQAEELVKFKRRLANKATDIDEGALLTDVLVKCGLAVSPKGEVTLDRAVKLISDGNISVNGVKVDDVNMKLFMDDGQPAPNGAFFRISKGTLNNHTVFIEEK